ncbi:MAG: nucleotidyltransferase domain-containing protein [Candidatus Omnitrophica bacterium]|nr:nucleotidyltransferase domain-containing protein [Candidatus Omnitrophota bacterium]MBU4479520.1 nucleotidyltransferase domain-containing protein [Candidatus Omnitrophota bacterium]
MNDKDKVIITKLRGFLKEMASEYPIEIVFLYGSFASVYHHAGSDIDIGIFFSESVEKAEKAHFFITEITYKLIQEFSREVNIISIDRNFLHPMLYYNVIISGIPLFIKDDGKFLSLKLEAIHQMEDFQLFAPFWQRTVTKKIMKGVSYG